MTNNDNSPMYVLTKDGWKRTKPYRWYVRPFVWIAEIFSRKDKVHDTKGVLNTCRQ